MYLTSIERSLLVKIEASFLFQLDYRLDIR
jgi:hypothetical protein